MCVADVFAGRQAFASVGRDCMEVSARLGLEHYTPLQERATLRAGLYEARLRLRRMEPWHPGRAAIAARMQELWDSLDAVEQRIGQLRGNGTSRPVRTVRPAAEPAPVGAAEPGADGHAERSPAPAIASTPVRPAPVAAAAFHSSGDEVGPEARTANGSKRATATGPEAGQEKVARKPRPSGGWGRPLASAGGWVIHAGSGVGRGMAFTGKAVVGFSGRLARGMLRTGERTLSGVRMLVAGGAQRLLSAPGKAGQVVRHAGLRVAGVLERTAASMRLGLASRIRRVSASARTVMAAVAFKYRYAHRRVSTGMGRAAAAALDLREGLASGVDRVVASTRRDVRGISAWLRWRMGAAASASQHLARRTLTHSGGAISDGAHALRGLGRRGYAAIQREGRTATDRVKALAAAASRQGRTFTERTQVRLRLGARSVSLLRRRWELASAEGYCWLRHDLPPQVDDAAGRVRLALESGLRRGSEGIARGLGVALAGSESLSRRAAIIAVMIGKRCVGALHPQSIRGYVAAFRGSTQGQAAWRSSISRLLQSATAAQIYAGGRLVRQYLRTASHTSRATFDRMRPVVMAELDLAARAMARRLRRLGARARLQVDRAGTSRLVVSLASGWRRRWPSIRAAGHAIVIAAAGAFRASVGGLRNAYSVNLAKPVRDNMPRWASAAGKVWTSRRDLLLRAAPSAVGQERVRRLPHLLEGDRSGGGETPDTRAGLASFPFTAADEKPTGHGQG